MLIDTHCHLNMMVDKKIDAPLTPENISTIDLFVQEATNCGIGAIINIGTSIIESQNSMALAQHYNHVYAVIGLHPCDCTEQWQRDFDQINNYLEQKDTLKIVGLGETGLDFFHKPFDQKRQEQAFRAHIECSLIHNVPLVLHVRDAAEEILTILQDYRHEKLTGVFHCFLQSLPFAQQVIEWGFYLGFGAPVTYPKNTELRELIKHIPLERIVLETDAPFLPPQALRGKQNKPSYIPLFAPVIADCKQITPEKLAQETTRNAITLFGLQEVKTTP